MVVFRILEISRAILSRTGPRPARHGVLSKAPRRSQQRLRSLIDFAPNWLEGYRQHHLDVIRRGQAVTERFNRVTIYITEATTATGSTWAGAIVRNRHTPKFLCGKVHPDTNKQQVLLIGLNALLSKLKGRVSVRIISKEKSLLLQVLDFQDNFKRFGTNQGWLFRTRSKRLSQHWQRLGQKLPRQQVKYRTARLSRHHVA